MYPFLPARNVSTALHFTNKHKSYFRRLERKKKKRTENELKKCQVSSLFRLGKLLRLFSGDPNLLFLGTNGKHLLLLLL